MKQLDAEDVQSGLASARHPFSLSLVVPVFDEQVRLAESGPQLVEFMSRFAAGSELIIADDGSSDSTLDVATRLQAASTPRVTVLRLPHAGKGAALRAGLQSARGEFSAFCDVDLATPLEDVERLVLAATAGPVMAIASRDVVTTTIVRPESPERELLGKLYNRLVQTALVPGIRDTQCGAKAASSMIWKEILPHTHEVGFAWDVEVIGVARKLGLAVWEYGVAWSHDSRSKVRPLHDGIAMVRAVPRILRSVRRVSPLRIVEHPNLRLVDIREMGSPAGLVAAG